VKASEILAAKTQPTVKVPILLDAGLLAERDAAVKAQASAERKAAMSNDRAVQRAAVEAAEHVADLDAKTAEATVHFELAALPRSEFNALKAECPPIEEDTDMDIEKFGPLLLAAASVDPELSVEESQQIFEDWPEAEVVQLFNGAYRLNMEVRGIPLAASGLKPTVSSDSKSNTADQEESP
jgi:hypothetical protein